MKLEDEDKVLLLLNALTKTFENFKDILLFKKEQITPEEVQTLIQTKEINKF